MVHPLHPPPPPSARPLFQQQPLSSAPSSLPIPSPKPAPSSPSTVNKTDTTESNADLAVPPLMISPSSPSSAAPPPPPSITSALPQSYTTQLSDLLLSAVVPGIPKGTPAAKGVGGKGVKAGDAVGGTRVLSSKKEELNLSSMTNNFRKFVLKIGWLFDLQDRVEEVIFWKKPSWSILFLTVWTTISFHPHLILPLLPLILLIVLLSSYDHLPSQASPSSPTTSTRILQPPVNPSNHLSRDSSPTNTKTLFRSSASSVLGQHGRSASMSEESPTSPVKGGVSGRDRLRKMSEFGSAHHHPHSSTLPHPPPTAPPPNLSSVYYSNLQGIQNLMGVFSDLHDAFTPLLPYLSPSHPLHHLLILACLLSIFGLGLVGWLIPGWVIMLPLGWLPVIVGGLPVSFELPPPLPVALTRPLHTLHLALLNDQLPLSYDPSFAPNDSSDEQPSNTLAASPTSTFSSSLISLITSPTTLLSTLSDVLIPCTSPLGPSRTLYPLSIISVFENERYRLLNPKDPSSGAWQPDASRWSGREVGSSVVGGGGDGTSEGLGGLEQLTFPEESGWLWIPGEEFYADRIGDWVDEGGDETDEKKQERKVDSEGWTYTSPLHSTLSPFPYEVPGSSTSGVPGMGDVQLGSLRRRRWWRRAVKID